MSEPLLLAVAALPLSPARDGYAVRVRGLLEGLSASWRIVLVSPPDREAGAGSSLPVEQRIEVPAALFARQVTAPPRETGDALRRLVNAGLAGRRPDAAILWCGAEFLAFGDADFPPAVVDRIDCYSLTVWRGLRAARSARGALGRLTDFLAVARHERRVARHFEATVVVGEDDARMLRRLSGSGSIHVIPNGVHVAEQPSAAAEDPRPTVSFTGALDYEPNREAARYLAREIWPAVRAVVPDAELLIAGRSPAPDVAALAEIPGVSVLADVPSLEAVHARSWVSAAPMRSGSGIKNKVLEAWGQARPVVLSPLAANGLQLDEATSAYVAPTAERMVAILVRLLRSPEERHRIGQASYRIALERHSWREAAERLNRLLEAAVAGRGAVASGSTSIGRPH